MNVEKQTAHCFRSSDCQEWGPYGAIPPPTPNRALTKASSSPNRHHKQAPSEFIVRFLSSLRVCGDDTRTQGLPHRHLSPDKSLYLVKGQRRSSSRSRHFPNFLGGKMAPSLPLPPGLLREPPPSRWGQVHPDVSGPPTFIHLPQKALLAAPGLARAFPTLADTSGVE